MIKVNGEYSQDDYLLANRIHMRNTKSQRILKIIFIILAVYCILNILANPINIQEWIFFIIFLVYINYSYTILPIWAKKYFKEQKQLHGNVTISLDNDKIISQSPIEYNILKWLHHITITKEMILLYNTPNTFLLLPRKWFSNIEQFEAAILLLKSFPAGKNKII